MIDVPIITRDRMRSGIFSIINLSACVLWARLPLLIPIDICSLVNKESKLILLSGQKSSNMRTKGIEISMGFERSPSVKTNRMRIYL
jgi:hypothetical protein